MLSSTLLDDIRRSYNGLYRMNAVSQIIFVIIGLAIIVCSFFVGPVGKPIKGDAPFVFCIGLVIAAVGAGAMFLARRKHVDLVDIIRNRPREIVWVYRKVNTAKMTGVAIAQFEFIVFGLMSKQQVAVRLPQAAVQTLLQELPQVLGHATLGYNVELEKTFRRDPAALLN